MKRYTRKEKEEILKEAEDLGNVSLTAKKHSIPYTTIHGWIRKGLKDKTNPSELRRLKKIISEQELQISILKELLKKTHQVF